LFLKTEPFFKALEHRLRTPHCALSAQVVPLALLAEPPR
jgi:hypothetical protein